MAARIRKPHQDEVRAKIQASQLINVLQNHALGELEELSPSRIKAIEILLKKSIPDLSQVEVSNPEGEEFKVSSTWNVQPVMPLDLNAKPSS